MATTLTPLPKFYAETSAGIPLVGGKLYTYTAGTTTPLATYTDQAGGTANTNPVVLDASGRADVWLAQDAAYKFVLKDALENTLWTVDGIRAPADFATFAATSPTGASLIGYKNNLSGATARTVQTKLQDILSVKDFGAVGDGSTDDTAAIQAAIDALSAASGGLIWFPRGVYMISSALALPANATGYVLRGEGKYNTILRTSSETAHMITAPSSAQLTVIEDMQFDSSVTRTAGSAIILNDSQQFLLSRLRFVDTYNIISINGADNGIIDDIQVSHGSGAINRGIWLQSAIDIRISRVVISGGNLNLDSANAWFMVDSGCDTVDISHSVALCTTGTGKGLIVSHSLSPSSFAPQWLRVTNCYFESSSGAAGNANAQDGITISAGLNLYFAQDYVATSKNGIVITGGEDIRFNETIVVNCDRHGISLATCDIVTIRDSTISDCSAETTNTYDGINIASTATNVDMGGLYIGDAILTNAAKMRYGVNNASANCMLGTALFGNFGTGTANGIVGPMSGSYTPVWTGAGGNPSIGDGTITGEWFRTEKGITVVISVTMGASTTYGSGIYSFSLPFATTSTLNTIGQCQGVCAGAVVAGAAVIGGTASTVRCIANGGSNFFTDAVPGTWASGDSLNITVTYQHRP